MTTQGISAKPVAGGPWPVAREERQLHPSRAARQWPLAAGCALTCAGLLYLCYFPVAAGWLAWVALVPLLVLVRSPARARTLYLWAWVGGLAFYWPVLQWLRVADPRMYFTWAGLATVCSLYFPLALFLVRRLDRRTVWPLLVTFPVVWTALEFFRANFMGGFASWLLGSHQHDYPGGFGWYLLGYTQHDFLPLIQVADLAGVYAVSFLVCLVNVLLFEVLYVRPWFRKRFAPGAPPRYGRLALLGQGLAVLALLLAALGYGSWRLHQDVLTPGPRLALIQGNADQRLRNDTSADSRKEVRVHYDDLTALALRHRPDLLVWPETSYPVEWEELAPGVPSPACQALAHALAADWGTPALLGMNSAVVGNDRHVRRYNSAILIDAAGRLRGRYDKIHRVPFGEYVPMRGWLPWLNNLAPYDFDYSVHPGAGFTCFGLDGRPATAGGLSPFWTFGVLICYEDSVAEMALPYVRGERPESFLINISNDGWFNGTSEHDEHLAICRFRAIECRRSVARAVNMGISALIDSTGRVLRPRRLVEQDGAVVWEVPAGQREELPVSRWGEFKKVAGVVLAAVPLDGRSSLYARWGNWLPAGCWGFVLVGLVRSAVRRPRPAPGSGPAPGSADSTRGSIRATPAGVPEGVVAILEPPG
jgi:apolipoprotein N-acyltransferase